MIFSRPAISVINKILQTNDGARKLLSQYSGKSFILQLPLFSINAVIDNDGYMQYLDSTKADTHMTIPLHNLKYFIDKDKFNALKAIEIEGDYPFAHALLKILSQLHFNLIYQTKSDGGIIVTNLVINGLKQLSTYLKRLGQNSSQSLSEYIQYESMDIVNRYELEEFYHKVDQLNASIDRLNHRYNHLERK